ncbi:ABC transporter substrate-binding protein, partial [Pseudomonadota bacterium]
MAGRAKWVLSPLLTVAIVVFVSIVIIYLNLFESVKPEKKYLIGIVNPSHSMQSATPGFISTLDEYGYRDGENARYIIVNDKKGLDAGIDELIRQNVNLIYSVSTPVTNKVKAATRESRIPVVFIMHDPVSSGVISTLENPGGNLTGIQVRGSTPKALEWLRQIEPSATHVFAPIGFDTHAAKQSLGDLEGAIEQAGFKLSTASVNSTEQLSTVLANMPDDTDAIFLLHSLMLFSNIEAISKYAVEKRIPIVSSHYHSKVLFSYGVDGYRVGEQSARIAHSILIGNSPSDI